MIEEIFLDRINLVNLDLKKTNQSSLKKYPSNENNYEDTLRILMVKDLHKNSISVQANARLMSISHLFIKDLRFFDCMNNFYEKFRLNLDHQLLEYYLESLTFWCKKLND